MVSSRIWWEIFPDERPDNEPTKGRYTENFKGCDYFDKTNGLRDLIDIVGLNIICRRKEDPQTLKILTPTSVSVSHGRTGQGSLLELESVVVWEDPSLWRIHNDIN